MSRHNDEGSNLNSKEVRIETPTVGLPTKHDWFPPHTSDCICTSCERHRHAASAIHSSVDAANAPSPSQNVEQRHAIAHAPVCTCPICCPGKWEANAAVRLQQTQLQCGSTSHKTANCPQNNAAMAGSQVDWRQEQAGALSGKAAAGVAGVRPSGIPCPNCQQHGPHLCPDHDALRWAAQDELNAANARTLETLRRQIAALDLVPNIESQLTDNIYNGKRMAQEGIAELRATVAGINKRVNNTPASAVEQAAADIKQKWEELQRTLNQRFQAMQDHNHGTLERWKAEARAVIGSDVPAAAVPSSPNYDDLLQRTHDLAKRLTALEAEQQKAHVGAWEPAPKVAVWGAWIACSERMPTNCRYVIVAHGAEITAAGWYGPVTGWVAHGERLHNVTHWQPAPLPPTTV